MFKCIIFKKNVELYKCHYSKQFLVNKNFYRFILRFSSYICKSPLETNIKVAIEKKWKDYVSNFKFDAQNTSNKYYVLSMFPYPSGNLHMGHVRVYTISDVIARFHRLNGKNVLHPMGFDAFGLPAENAALENKVNPIEWTYHNIKSMKKQLMSLCYSFDWDREIITCSKDYYRFTQYLFLKLYEAGLIYRKEALVNWDPVDKTVLADEQVDSDGRSWRSGAHVEKKLLKQWFIKTTTFALSLYEGLNDPKLKDWGDIIKLQKHWIGNCNGATFEFDIMEENKKISTVNIWTEYPENIKYSCFVVASPDSILGLKNNKKIGKLNCVAVNPFNNFQIPIFISDRLEFEVGRDIKLGIPCKYETDKAFANEHNIAFKDCETSQNFDHRLRVCELARDAEIGGYPVSSKLRDWLISRQRFWGTPIPVIYCNDCGIVPCKFEDLPVDLHGPEETTCPKCNKLGKREKDTMDTFVDSSWYFLRYIDPNHLTEPYSIPKAEEIMPVDLYIGGKEHAVLHLYYARFMSYFLHSIGFLKEPEPFRRLIVQGMIMGKTYQVKKTGKYLKKEKVENKSGKWIDIETGNEVIEMWEKMSKSKYNGVEPEEVIKEYGIDTTRLLIISDVAPTTDRHWKTDTFLGVLNWQKRLWTLIFDFISAKQTSNKNFKYESIIHVEEELWDTRNFYIKGITYNYVFSHQLSVAISKMQGLTKSLRKCSPHVMSNSLEFERTLAALLIMMFPMAPHFSSELWQGFQSVSNKIDVHRKYIEWDKPIAAQKWPILDDNYNLDLICKVNNAVKATIKLPTVHINNLSDEDALNIALAEKNVISFLKGRDVLNYEYNIQKNSHAIINMEVDHLQQMKFL